MSTVRYTRAFKPGDTGSDVEAVGRALCRAGVGLPIRVFEHLPLTVRRTWGPRKQAWIRTFKRRHRIPVSIQYGERVHAALSPFFDSKAKHLMNDWVKPVHMVEPRQGWNSLYPALWEIYSIGRNMGLYDLGTYNPSSTLPGGGKSDHAFYPSYAADLGCSPATGQNNDTARAFFHKCVDRPEIEYVILGNKIWSRSSGLHAYTYGGHENHVHISGRHGWRIPPAILRLVT